MEMRLPGWVRSIVAISALMQLGFGIVLLLHPARISELWPWTLPPLTARLLGASTLVSIPLAFLSIGINRYGMAMIPFVMMLTYRVLQLVAGVIHIDRFAANSTLTLNYFGGGLLMLVVFAYPLIAGSRGRLPKASAEAPFATSMPWRPHPLLRDGLAFLAGALIVLGLAFLILGGNAKGLWFDAKGMTPLTARLFASPLIGLGLGMALVSGAADWREIMIAAIGMVTIGVLATLALVLSGADFAPQSPLAWLVASLPLILLIVGLVLLQSRPPSSPDAHASAQAMRTRKAA
jgi:hypothetical protein